MKAMIARGFLWFAVVWWAIWFGGQLFNAMMVVPYMSSNPPVTTQIWGQMRSLNVADFFFIFNSIWIAIALAASLLIGWKTHRAARFFVILSLAAAILSLGLLAWMVPTVMSIVMDKGLLGVADIQSSLESWQKANWIRLAIEAVGFASALIALRFTPGFGANKVEPVVDDQTPEGVTQTPQDT